MDLNINLNKSVLCTGVLLKPCLSIIYIAFCGQNGGKDQTSRHPPLSVRIQYISL